MTALSAASFGAPRSHRAWLAAWPLYPLILFLAAFFAYPVVQLLWLSFTDPAGHFSLLNYTRIATAPVYLQVLGITFRIAAWTTVFAILAGYPVAYLLATLPERRRDALMLLVLMPFWTSFLVRTFAWMVLLGRNGAVNQLLLALGIVEAPVALIYNFTGVMIGMVQGMMPLAILAMLSVMQNIDTTLMKAAHTLGARGGLLAHLLPPLPAGGGGRGPPRLHHRPRLLHHPGPPRGCARDHDLSGDHLRDPGADELALCRSALARSPRGCGPGLLSL